MSKKKQKGNGFFIFMQEMQQDLRNRGTKVSMKDMSTVAGPKWAQLPDAKKRAYQAVAKQGRGAGFSAASDLNPPFRQGTPRVGKMDSTGVLLSERRDHVAEMIERRKKEREIIKKSLPPVSKLPLEKFLFIDIQSLCEIKRMDTVDFLPCEVAIIEYSLHSGSQRYFHRFIDPGKIPMGYRFIAQSTSDTTHQIPISDFDRAENDYRKILGDMEHFIDPEWTEVMPPLYSKHEYAEKVEQCLGWLADKAGVMNRLTKVYEVEALICQLSEHRDGNPQSFFQAEEMLKTSVYDHDNGTRCDYHEEKEAKHCSLGVCNLYSYVVSEAICPRFGISLTADHLPKLSAVVVRTRNPSKQSERSWVNDRSADACSLRTEDFSTPKPKPPKPVLGRGRGFGRGSDLLSIRQPRQVGGLQPNN